MHRKETTETTEIGDLHGAGGGGRLEERQMRTLL